jgi:hypothetical protein
MSTKSDLMLYRRRWKAVERIAQQELRALTTDQHWEKINAIARFAFDNGLRHGDDGEMAVFLRWAKLKVPDENTR